MIAQLNCNNCKQILFDESQIESIVKDKVGVYLILDKFKINSLCILDYFVFDQDKQEKEDQDDFEDNRKHLLLNKDSIFDNLVYNELCCKKCKNLNQPLGKEFVTFNQTNQNFTICKYVVDQTFIEVKNEYLMQKEIKIYDFRDNNREFEMQQRMNSIFDQEIHRANNVYEKVQQIEKKINNHYYKYQNQIHLLEHQYEQIRGILNITDYQS